MKLKISNVANSISQIVVRIFRQFNISSPLSIKSTIKLRDIKNHSILFQDTTYVKFAEVMVDSKAGYCFADKKTIIEESSSWPRKDLIKGSIPRPVLRSKPVSLQNDGLLLSSTGFYHWLLEDLPGFIRVFTQNSDVTPIIFRKSPRYVTEFLEFIDVKYVQLERFSVVKQVKIPLKPQNVGTPTFSDIQTLRNFFPDSIGTYNSKSKIYVSRLNSSRSPIFEREFQRYLQRDNWKVVYLEELSLLKQIETFKNAATIMGIHGAGLSGMIFSSTETQVIEIFPSDRDIQCFLNISKVTGQKMFRVPYESNSREIPKELISLVENYSK